MFHPQAYSEQTYGERVEEKFARGVMNITFSYTEFSIPLEQDIERNEFWRKGGTHALLGIPRTLGRALVGLYEMTTCFVPHRPILKPLKDQPNTEDWIDEGQDSTLDTAW